MTLTFDNQTLLLVGVGAQLLGSLAKTLFKKPAQQAQIDRIEAKVNDTLATVAPALSALAAPNNSKPPPPSWVASAQGLNTGDTTKGTAS